MKIIYPNGSIISKKEDNNKYCIINVKNDSYSCILYPYGITNYQSIINVKFDEVNELLFLGHKNKKYENTLKNRLLDCIMRNDKK